jgi:hypothetical protein
MHGVDAIAAARSGLRRALQRQRRRLASKTLTRLRVGRLGRTHKWRDANDHDPQRVVRNTYETAKDPTHSTHAAERHAAAGRKHTCCYFVVTFKLAT